MTRSPMLCLLLAVATLVGCKTNPGQWDDAVNQNAWQLTKIDGDAPLPRRVPTLDFSEDGRVAGLAGANRYFGTYESSPDGAIRFGTLGSTRMILNDPPGLMKQEQHFLEALGAVDTYEVKPSKLVLRADGAVRLVFVPASPEAE